MKNNKNNNNLMPLSDIIDEESNQPLDSIMIAAPCSMSWEEMKGDERVRLCGGCNKNVYNTSAMTASEVSKLLSKDGPLPCLRIYRRADGTLVTRDCPNGLKRVRASWQNLKRLVAAAWLALLGMNGASTQVVSAQGISSQSNEQTKVETEVQTEVPADIAEKQGPVTPPKEMNFNQYKPHDKTPLIIDEPLRRERRTKSGASDKAEFTALTEYKLALCAVKENEPAKADDYFRGAIASLDKAKHDSKFEREVFTAYANFLKSRHRDVAAKAIMHKLELREKAAGIYQSVDAGQRFGTVVGGIPIMAGAKYGLGVPLISKPLKPGQKPDKLWTGRVRPDSSKTGQ